MQTPSVSGVHGLEVQVWLGFQGKGEVYFREWV